MVCNRPRYLVCLCMNAFVWFSRRFEYDWRHVGGALPFKRHATEGSLSVSHSYTPSYMAVEQSLYSARDNS
jgi:hypothetical protein